MTKSAWSVQRRSMLAAGVGIGALLAAVSVAGPAAGAVGPGGAAAARGSQLWAQRYNGPANGPDQATSIAASPNGRWVYVTGPSAGASKKADYATIAYNAVTGATRWVSRYN